MFSLKIFAVEKWYEVFSVNFQSTKFSSLRGKILDEILRQVRGAYLRTICHMGADDEYEINHWRFQMYLGVFGQHCRRITFQPIEHFYNLFEFLRASQLTFCRRLLCFRPVR